MSIAPLAPDPAAANPTAPDPALRLTYNPAILGNRQAVTAGYGVKPRTVAHRALLVRSAIQPARPTKRPLLFVVGGALLGILGWLVMTLVLVEFIADHYRFVQPGQSAQLALAVPAYLGGIALFSYGWQLGDRGKAITFGIWLAIAGIVLWLIVALVAVLVVGLAGLAGGGSSGSGGGGSHSGSGSHGSGSPAAAGPTTSGSTGFLGGVFRGGGGYWSWSHPDATAPQSPLAQRCPNCRNMVPAGLTVCPACGHSMEPMRQAAPQRTQ